MRGRQAVKARPGPCRKQEHAAAQAADQAALLAERLRREIAGAQHSADGLRAQDSALKEAHTLFLQTSAAADLPELQWQCGELLRAVPDVRGRMELWNFGRPHAVVLKPLWRHGHGLCRGCTAGRCKIV